MLIGLNGYMRSGKDTVGAYLCKHYGFHRVALADPLKVGLLALNPYIDTGVAFVRLADIIHQGGWEAAKQIPDVRKSLQRYGQEAGRDIHGKDCWIKLLGQAIVNIREQQPAARIVVTDVRYDNEADAITSWGGEIWRIDRPRGELDLSHGSEHLTRGPRRIIRNNSTVQHLETVIGMIMDETGVTK